MNFKTPKFWRNPPKITARLLWPFSQIYRFGYALHQYYQRLYAEKVGVPVIAVGSHLVGGSGKTPTTIMLAEVATKAKIKVHIVTRGYRGSIQGPYLVQKGDDPKKVGDEALLLAEVAPTWVAKNRTLGAKEAVKHGAELIILDDGMHHTRLHRDWNILVFDAAIECDNPYLLPAGPLRELLKNALMRTYMPVVLNSLPSITGLQDKALTPELKLDFHPDPKASYLAFTGIAYPEKFQFSLNKAGVSDMLLIKFPDHHYYTERQLQDLSNKAKEMSALLITTAKDYVKLSPKWQKEIIVANMRLELPQRELVWLADALLELCKPT